MGRRSRRSAAGHVPGGVGRLRQYPVVIAEEAMNELVELLGYIKKSSPKNAGSVGAAVVERLDRLSPSPLTGHADPNAPLIPRGAAAHVTTVKKVSLYYLFSLRRQGREIVYVLSIRRGSRMPLEEPEYVRRWMEELARMASLPDEDVTGAT